MTDLKDRLPAVSGPGRSVERAEPRQSVAELLRRAIDTQTPAFKAILPQGDAERFSRLVLTAVKATPKLMECFGTDQGQTTVLLSAMQCAALGLEPNTATQDAWLLPRWNGNTRSTECELSIGYRGYLKLARRSGVVKSIYAEVVHEKDEFHYERGLDNDVLRHVPSEEDDPGPLVRVYAVARFMNGGTQFVVLTRRQVEQRRAMSESWKNDKARPYSPWTKWTEEMWKKTAVRALVPYLELRTEEAAGVEADERRLVFKEEDGVIDVAPEPAGELSTPEPEAHEPVVDAGSSEAAGAGDPPPPAPASIDWIERINDIEHGPTKASAMKAFRAAFGMPPAVADDQMADALDLLADFEEASRKELGGREYTDEELAKMRRGLQAQATKAFPDKGTREAQRHALAYVALGGVKKSTTDMTGQELATVTARLQDVEAGHVSVELRDGVWFAVQGEQEIEIPAEVSS